MIVNLPNGEKVRIRGETAGFLGQDVPGDRAHVRYNADDKRAEFAPVADYVESIAALEALNTAPLRDGEIVQVLGYTTVNDGGGGLFYYDASSTATANGGTIFEPDSGTGRWLRIYSGALSVRWFGATGDGAADDTSEINAAISAASTLSAGAYAVQLDFPEGDYLTDGILVKSNVWLNFGSSRILKRTNGGSAATNSLIRAIETEVSGSYYGTYENIRISGGLLRANGFTAAAHLVRLLYIEGLVLENVCVQEYAAGAWAFCLGGNNITVRGCRTIGGDALFEDGIHVMFGKNIIIDGCDVESGDDSLVLGTEPSDVYVAADPYPIRNVSISNCVVRTEKAVGIKIYCQSGATGADYEISDVSISNVTGYSGVTRNGGISVFDLNGSAAGTSQIQRVNISDISLDVGSTSHDETNAYGIWLASVKNVVLSNIALKMTDKTTPSLGFILCYGTACENITIDNLRCDALQRRAGIQISDSANVRISGGKLVATAATTANYPVVLDDVLNADLDGLTILEARDASYGIGITTGTTTTVRIRGCRVAQVSTATTGGALGVISTAFAHVTLVDNDFSGCVTGTNVASFSAGASFLVGNNRNFVTQSQGTATVANGTTSIAVTHGLAMTPALSQIQVTPTNNLGAATKFWISGPTTTQFTINVDANPGATTATFVWFAEVGKKPV